MSLTEAFDLTGRVAVITGGGGLLGRRHARAIAEAGGIPVLVDINVGPLQASGAEFGLEFGPEAIAVEADITDLASVEQFRDHVLSRYGRVDILVNNAANNPQVGRADSGVEFSRLESFHEFSGRETSLWA